MRITKTSDSRIDSVDFSNLPFGRVFSDHMLISHYKNGSWQEAQIIPYGNISMTPGSQVLHYGQSVFEGMKAFKTNNDEVLIFRKEMNYDRLNQSAKRLSIPSIPKKMFIDGLNELVSLDSKWCKKEEGYSLYLRPFIFASSECIKASASEEYTFIIITAPTKNYYPHAIDLVIEEHYSRAAKGGVGFAKAAGNYAASFYPTKQANAKGFTQVIWTDAATHKNIEESGTMNIWFRINDRLITPTTSDSILAGITRLSILQLANDLGIDVEERVVSVDEIIKAHKEGILKEVFGTGTAVTVAPVQSLTYRDVKMLIPEQSNSYAVKLKKMLQDIQKGRIKDSYKWTTKVVSKAYNC